MTYVCSCGWSGTSLPFVKSREGNLEMEGQGCPNCKSLLSEGKIQVVQTAAEEIFSNVAATITEQIEVLREKIEEFEEGDRVTLTCRGIGCTLTKKATLVKKPHQNGFITPCGGWSSFQSAGDVPCYCIGVRFYKEKTIREVSLGQTLIDIKKGW